MLLQLDNHAWHNESILSQVYSLLEIYGIRRAHQPQENAPIWYGIHDVGYWGCAGVECTE